MSCCGKKRTQYYHSGRPSLAPEPAADGLRRARHVQPATVIPVLFEYVGKTALTALGRVTGRRYRFSRPGARVAVDRRDAPSLAAVPNLRQVR